MKVILDIKDDQAPELLELLKNLWYVETKTIGENDEFLIELNESIEQVKAAKKGIIKLKTLDEFIRE